MIHLPKCQCDKFLCDIARAPLDIRPQIGIDQETRYPVMRFSFFCYSQILPGGDPIKETLSKKD